MNYVVLPKPAIHEIMRGEANIFYVDNPAPLAARIAVKTARNRRATCLVEVTGCEPNTSPDSDAAFAVSVRVCPLEHEPVFLAQDSSTPFRGGSGYTTDPTKALRGEPEAILVHDLGVEWKTRAERRHEKATVERLEQQQQARALLTLEERLARARSAARFNGVDVSKELFLVNRALRKRRDPGVVERHVLGLERCAYRENTA